MFQPYCGETIKKREQASYEYSNEACCFGFLVEKGDSRAGS